MHGELARSKTVEAGFKEARAQGDNESAKSIEAFRELLEAAKPDEQLAILGSLHDDLEKANKSESKCIGKSSAYSQFAFLDATVHTNKDTGERTLVDADIVISSTTCGSLLNASKTMTRIDLFNNHPQANYYDKLQAERDASEFNIDAPYPYLSASEQVLNWLFPGTTMNPPLSEQMVFRQKGMSPLYPDHSHKALVVSYTTLAERRKLWNEKRTPESAPGNHADKTS